MASTSPGQPMNLQALHTNCPTVTFWSSNWQLVSYRPHLTLSIGINGGSTYVTRLEGTSDRELIELRELRKKICRECRCRVGPMKRLLSMLCRDIQLKTHLVQVSRVDSKNSECGHGVLTDPKYCVCVDEANLTSLTRSQ